MADQLPMEGLEQGYDPALYWVSPTDEASPEEERALATTLTSTLKYMYSDSGLANIVKILQQPGKELWENATDAAVPILHKARETAEQQAQAEGEALPSIFFGEGGMFQQVTEALFDVADQLQLPDASNPDQFAATLMNIHKAAGEYLLESGDAQAMSEAQDLAINMALTQPDGTMKSADQMMSKKQNPLAAGIQQALQGGPNV